MQEAQSTFAVWHARDPAIVVNGGELSTTRSADEYVTGVVLVALGAICMLPAMALIGIQLLMQEQEKKLERFSSIDSDGYPLV